MRRRAGIVAGIAALAAATAVAARATSPTPADVLQQAGQQTGQAKSIRLGMTISMRLGGRNVSFSANGTEIPAGHRVSLDMDLSQLSPMLGTEKVLMVGSQAYVHLDLLSTPAAKKKGLKPWISEDASSIMGVDPWELGGMGSSMQGIRSIKAAGTGTDEGVPVTSYTAKVSLEDAQAANPQFEAMVKALHLPAALLNTTMNARFDVDGDGYLREVAEAFTLRLPGQAAIAYKTEFTLGGFGEPVAPIVAPPSYDVMSMDDFRRATGAALPTIA